MSNKAKIREAAKELVPIDDIMFCKMAEDRDFCEEILRVILEDPKLTVVNNTPQYVGTNLQGRSVRLDTLYFFNQTSIQRDGGGKENNE